METRTLTLADFLLARIAEDEAAIRANWHRDGVTDERFWGTPFQPSRALAECEAKRRIVEVSQRVIRINETAPEDLRHISGEHRVAWHAALRILAVPYADHPDYCEEWRPF